MQALKCLSRNTRPWSRLLRYVHQAAAAEGPTTPLKDELRRLFKLVHPDMLHNLPAEQAINLRSFQLLQEYLDVAKGKSDRQRQYVYNFDFFIRRDGSDTDLYRVEISLPPPKVRVNPDRGPELLPDTRAAIGRLLAACGLSPAVTGGLTGGEDRRSFAEFFQQSSELQRQNESAALTLDQRMVVVRNALRMGRGITASFKSPLAEASGSQQLEALENLARALDMASSVAATGCTIVIGRGYGVDALGNVWLNYEDSVEAWSKFLQEADFVTANERTAAARARRLKEFEIAHLMKVEMVFTHSLLAVHPEYTSFLHRMAQESMASGPVGGGKFSELPVRVSGPNREGSDATLGAFSVDETMGYISVPVWEGLPNIYRYIEQQGTQALLYRKQYKTAERKLDQLKVRVRKSLRLRNLMLDVTLGNEQHLAACVRLLFNAPQLVKYTEGLSLAISDEWRLPVKGVKGYAYMKWDFDMADL